MLTCSTVRTSVNRQTLRYSNVYVYVWSSLVIDLKPYMYGGNNERTLVVLYWLPQNIWEEIPNTSWPSLHLPCLFTKLPLIILSQRESLDLSLRNTRLEGYISIFLARPFLPLLKVLLNKCKIKFSVVILSASYIWRIISNPDLLMPQNPFSSS